MRNMLETILGFSGPAYTRRPSLLDRLRTRRLSVIDQAKERLCVEHIKHCDAIERLEGRIQRDQALLDQHRRAKLALMEALMSFQLNEVSGDDLLS